MTRPDKHAARFGDDFWRIPTYADVDPRKVVRALRSFRPVVARMTQTIHAVRERWTFVSHIADTAAPTVAEFEAGRPLRGVSSVSFGTHSGGDVVDINTRGFTGISVAPPPTGGEIIANITRAADALRNAGWAVWDRPPEGLELGEDGRYRRRQAPSGDILDRIDETLLSYDSQRATGERPWPYGSF